MNMKAFCCLHSGRVFPIHNVVLFKAWKKNRFHKKKTESISNTNFKKRRKKTIARNTNNSMIVDVHLLFFHAHRVVFAAPKSIQATVTILENLHIILEKTPQDDIRSEILPLLFNAFESSTIQVQVNKITFIPSIYSLPLLNRYMHAWEASCIKQFDHSTIVSLFTFYHSLFLFVSPIISSLLWTTIGSGIGCCIQCIRVVRWDVNPENGIAKNQNCFREKP